MKMHSSFYPATCSFENCTSTAIYSSRGVLQRHLRGLHHLESFDDMLPHLPQPTTRKYVARRLCWLEGRSIKPEDRGRVRSRLMSKKHNMSEDEANASIQANTAFQVPTLKPPKKRAKSTKSLNYTKQRLRKLLSPMVGFATNAGPASDAFEGSIVKASIFMYMMLPAL
jgi:hypothetical protein